MDEPEPLARLPEAYRRALTLRRDGANDTAIAAQLGIPREAVAPLLRIAKAKLTTLSAPSTPTAHRRPTR